MEDAYYFVWVLDQCGNARPQIWAGDQFDRPDWQLQHVVNKHRIDAAERAMSLNCLAARYPLS
ncbi:hypothetical protein [Bradyrhizobium symbiodeficiens]|uniref:hypothetical protein n=1 Tax=Bradyrhizobium symbiodeficiens TaxID=1404367 RepID=UPI00140FF4DF|nr:hypothetical protein [Bradyrhizobium symbiodeficiens]QIO98857.1 hypothetical protein HAU86_03130 [Bradyrhizobium symbiodeficiens]